MTPPPGIPPRRRRMGPLARAGIGGGLAAALAVTWSATGGLMAGSASARSAGARSAGARSASARSAGAGLASPGRRGAGPARTPRITPDGRLAFRVISLTCGYSATLAVYSDPAVTGPQPVGSTECILTLRVTNRQARPQAFFDWGQYAHDARGRLLTADPDNAGLAGDQDGTRLRAGASITALVPFNIPAGDAITRLELHDSGLSGVSVRV
jgi:hypothetical protein